MDEVAEEDDDDEGLVRIVSEMCEAYTEKKLRSMVSLLLSEGRSSRSMAKAWTKLDATQRRHQFRFLGAYFLINPHSKLCTRLIECCCIHDTHPPTPEDVAWVLELVVRCELGVRKQAKNITPGRERLEAKATKFINLLMALLRVDFGGMLPLRQSTIYRLVQAASLEDVPRLYDCLKEAEVALSIDTMLHFIDRLSEPPTWTKAHSILRGLRDDRTRNLKVPQVWKGFQKLFYKATFIGEKESSTVIRMMLECGISPGLSSYNILMSNAARNGDEGSMMQIFRQMFEAGLKPSMVTYGLLHNFYKKQGKEAERVQVVRDAMKLDRSLNEIIATDIVHAKVLTSDNYLLVLDEYLNFFTASPLVMLGIAAPEHKVILRGVTQARLEPDHVAIAAMVHAFCMHECDPMVVWAAYQRYRGLLKSEGKKYNRQYPLRDAGPYIPNSYMHALGRHEETLWHCAAVMEDMLKSDSTVHANVYSWSILLYAMAKAQKTKQAEQVLGAMRRRGVKPNVVTWTSLLTGYVRMGRLRKAGEVLRRMSEERVEPNFATMNLLTSVVDSKEFTDGMMGVLGEQERVGSTEMTDEEVDRLLMRREEL